MNVQECTNHSCGESNEPMNKITRVAKPVLKAKEMKLPSITVMENQTQPMPQNKFSRLVQS